ncbi:MAG: nucleotide sugar dehydrogenase [Candidatus Eisenbacteria bacterium]|nr:nucleotide sugar dehydrogenase [Candidatus Eisenbacteria bacterium]
MTETDRVIKDICVLGLGYVGLPTAAILAVNGFQVCGVDPRADVVEAVNAGDVPIEEVGLKTVLQAAVNSGNLKAQTEPTTADAFIIAVPTPIRDDKTANLSFVEQAARSIVPHLQRGNLVVLESTVPPGTTDGMLVNILEESGFRAKEDLFVAHCPERILPGRILTELVQNDRVIGGIDDQSASRAATIYRPMVEGEVLLTTAVAAELAKLVENASRDVGIAFANEVARISRHFGADGHEVIALANRHPRVEILNPGPGVGGHCIPVDPWFLVEAAPEQAHLIRMARETNDAQPVWVAERVISELRGIHEPKISLWGVAYKGNVDDARETPALTVIRALEERGARVSPVDFHVKRFPYQLDDIEASVTDADCILVVTDHREFRFFEPGSIGQAMRHRLVFDARNCLPRELWEKSGFRFVTL